MPRLRRGLVTNVSPIEIRRNRTRTASNRIRLQAEVVIDLSETLDSPHVFMDDSDVIEVPLNNVEVELSAVTASIHQSEVNETFEDLAEVSDTITEDGEETGAKPLTGPPVPLLSFENALQEARRILNTNLGEVNVLINDL